MTDTAPVDPRGPRFAASITSALLLVALVLSLTGVATARASASFGWFAYQPLADAVFVPGHAAWLLPHLPLSVRVSDAGFILMLLIALLFLWSVLSPRTHPWAVLFRRAVRPHLAAPSELEDPRPPRFAQGVGLTVVGVGLVLHLSGVPLALPIAAAAAFVAAFLNAAFGFCLGCQMYLLLQRAGILGRPSPAS